MATKSYPPVHLPTTGPGNWIRVLDILPGRFGSDVHLELRLHNLSDESREYEALSYTWGVRTLGQWVTVNNDYRLPVTDNLYRALQRARLCRNRRTIWIDAICIDQENFEERSSQVAIMGHIYHKATLVNVLLGEPVAVTAVNHNVVPHAPEMHSFRVSYEGEPQTAAKVARGEHIDLESAMRKPYSPWYERVWITQEFVLAR